MSLAVSWSRVKERETHKKQMSPSMQNIRSTLLQIHRPRLCTCTIPPLLLACSSVDHRLRPILYFRITTTYQTYKQTLNIKSVFSGTINVIAVEKKRRRGKWVRHLQLFHLVTYLQCEIGYLEVSWRLVLLHCQQIALLRSRWDSVSEIARQSSVLHCIIGSKASRDRSHSL